MKKPDRGIDTLFRVTLNNHTRLSDIADSKANILLSVNAIIISIALSTLLPKLASEKSLFDHAHNDYAFCECGLYNFCNIGDQT